MPYSAPDLRGRSFTILGAGTLGMRIALMWLTCGETVHLFDTNSAALEKAKAYIDEQLAGVIEDLVKDGKPGTLKTFTDRSAALEKAWIVVEAVPEILDLKINLLGELDAILPSDVILATNSSSYTPSEIGTKVQNRDRLVSTHYYMPPVSLPVEVMPIAETSPEIAPLLLKEASRHGLKPFHVRKESVGLMANRIWAAIKRECMYVAAEGIATPAEIDELVILALGFARGPFQTMDQVGLDVVADIERHYHQTRSGLPREPLEYVEKFVKEGKLGIKSGEGFYNHPKEVAHEEDRLIALDIVKGQVISHTLDGGHSKILVDGLKNMPDGVQASRGFLYWTGMGKGGKPVDGSLWKSKIDGTEVTCIIEEGKTHTPKQLVFEESSQTLYWCDREGGRIQRCGTDGSNLTTLYDSAPGVERPLANGEDWCVGITLDVTRKLVYWTQKGTSKGSVGRIFRANMEIPSGQSAEARKDIEVLFDHLPEPIDLELDSKTQTLYCEFSPRPSLGASKCTERTDRGDPPFGNTLNKANVKSDLSPESKPKGPSADHIVAERFHETIGLALDEEKSLAYVSDLLGSIWVVDLKTNEKKALVRDRGNFSGIILVKGKK